MDPDTKYTGYDCPERDASGKLPVEYMAAVMLGYNPDCDNLEMDQQPGHNFRRETVPTWNWSINNYRLRRPAPAPVYANWTAEDVPAVCWLMQRGGQEQRLVCAITEASVRVPGHGDKELISYSTLRNCGWLYSTDRKTWLPCRKAVTP